MTTGIEVAEEKVWEPEMIETTKDNLRTLVQALTLRLAVAVPILGRQVLPGHPALPQLIAMFPET
jgi:hypothetical protein